MQPAKLQQVFLIQEPSVKVLLGALYTLQFSISVPIEWSYSFYVSK